MTNSISDAVLCSMRLELVICSVFKEARVGGGIFGGMGIQELRLEGITITAGNSARHHLV